MALISAVDSGGAGGARVPPEFGGLEKGQSLISAYQSLAITTNTPGFEKLNTALKAISNISTTLVKFAYIELPHDMVMAFWSTFFFSSTQYPLRR